MVDLGQPYVFSRPDRWHPAPPPLKRERAPPVTRCLLAPAERHCHEFHRIVARQADVLPLAPGRSKRRRGLLSRHRIDPALHRKLSLAPDRRGTRCPHLWLRRNSSWRGTAYCPFHSAARVLPELRKRAQPNV